MPVSTINFMIHYGYFVRILRGLYYVKSLEKISRVLKKGGKLAVMTFIKEDF